eukprot:gene4256-4507_t
MLGKGIDCKLQHATQLDNFVSAGASLNTTAYDDLSVTKLPAAALCGADSGVLAAGIYTLQATMADGFNGPYWRCFAMHAAEHIAAEATNTSVTFAGVAMLGPQAVQLEAGNSYVCIATYTQQSREQQAAVAAISWPDVMVAAYSSVSISTNSSTSCTPPAYTPPARGKPAPPLKTNNWKIVNAVTGKRVIIRGLNWFGFNVPMGMVDGLWAGGSKAATDFSAIAYQIKLLGYNAVRLPFTHGNLANANVWDLVRECEHMSRADFKKRIVDPHVWAQQGQLRALPANPAPQKFIALGLYVVVDYQPMGLEQHPYNLGQFVGAWVDLWKQIVCLPNFNSDMAGRIMVDVMNEPDSMGIRWEPQGDKPGAEQLYLATAQAIWNISPGQVLFLFEGTGQNMFGLNWGNGFITDQAIIQQKGLSDPTNFFRQLLTRDFAKAAIFTPHVYPPTITKSTFLGKELWEQSRTAFAYLQNTGFCDGGTCTRFPVFVGETGSAFTDETDKKWLNDFAEFLNARGAAREYNTELIGGWLWWAYNENSGDTGGIVMNNWQDFNWEKIRYMTDKLGLKPWFGFEIPMGMLDGLWAGGADAATDYAKIAYQMTLLGYNAVRIPFAHLQLANTNTHWLYGDCNPLTDQQIKQRTVDPAVWSSAFDARRRLPENPSPQPNNPPNKCNSYLPATSNMDRFLQVIQQLIAVGMYVILDYHPQNSETQAYDLTAFVDAWVNLWASVTCLPNFESDMAGRIILDIMNEPDSMGIRWEPQGSRPGAEQLYLAAADALWAATPNKVFFMFEGTGQNMYGLNWGNGFITDRSILTGDARLSDPNGFFQKLITKPYYGTAAIISPHLYPPSITLSTFLGPALWQQSNEAFGYLQTTGYQGRVFPIVVGETGSLFATPDDRQWLEDFAAFCMSRGSARVYNPAPLDGWLWWAWNENAGDTGGIVKDGWQNFDWMKITYMVDKLGLRPWYRTTLGQIGRKLRTFHA